jgi:hypothetical protein
MPHSLAAPQLCNFNPTILQPFPNMRNRQSYKTAAAAAAASTAQSEKTAPQQPPATDQA